MRKFLFALSTGAALACGGPASSGSGELASSVSLSLKSEPMKDTTAVYVTVRGVDLLVANGSSSHAVPVSMDGPVTVNLMDFADSGSALLGSASVDGKITQIRLAMDGSVEVVSSDGTTRTARVPSGDRTGIKIITQGGIDPSATDIELAFDPAKSIHETGNGELIMRPTIKIGQVSCDGGHGSGGGTTPGSGGSGSSPGTPGSNDGHPGNGGGSQGGGSHGGGSQGGGSHGGGSHGGGSTGGTTDGGTTTGGTTTGGTTDGGTTTGGTTSGGTTSGGTTTDSGSTDGGTVILEPVDDGSTPTGTTTGGTTSGGTTTDPGSTDSGTVVVIIEPVDDTGTVGTVVGGTTGSTDGGSASEIPPLTLPPQ